MLLDESSNFIHNSPPQNTSRLYMHHKEEKSPPQKIGALLAVIQSYIDDLFASIFKKLKKVGTKTPHVKNPETLKDHASSAVHKSASFIGELGESYYKTYNKLKAKKIKERK